MRRHNETAIDKLLEIIAAYAPVALNEQLDDEHLEALLDQVEDELGISMDEVYKLLAELLESQHARAAVATWQLGALGALADLPEPLTLIAPLARMLATESADDAAGALNNIVLLDVAELAPAVVQAGALPALVAMLDDDDIDRQSSASHALTSLAQAGAELCDQLLDAQLLRPLARMMGPGDGTSPGSSTADAHGGSRSKSTHVLALGVLANLAGGASDAGVERIAADSVRAHLSAVLESGASKAAGDAHAASLLWHTTRAVANLAREPAQRAQLCEWALPPLLELLRAEGAHAGRLDAQIVTFALLGVAHLAGGASSGAVPGADRIGSRLANLGVVDALLPLLQPSRAELCALAAEALEKVAGFDAVRTRLTTNPALSHTVAERLLALLSPSNELSAQYCAACTIAQLGASDALRPALEAAGAVRALTQLLTDGKPGVWRPALRALERWLPHPAGEHTDAADDFPDDADNDRDNETTRVALVSSHYVGQPNDWQRRQHQPA